MKRYKCKSCAFYEPFFNSCQLHFNEVYLGEGIFYLIPVNIKNVNKSECMYEAKEKYYG